MADSSCIDSRFSPYYRLSSVRFLNFTAEEIKKMSCKRLTNPNTFDSLLHPNPGGLHDPALGPCDKFELCGTCGLNYIHCPGHLGHIVLPLTVFHPIFFQSFYKILRGSCLLCGRFLSSIHRTEVFKGQIKLLDKGLVSDALELEAFVSDGTAETKEEKSTNIVEQTHSYVESCLEQASVSPAADVKSKHLTNLRQLFIDEFFNSLSTTRCPHCEAPVRKFRQDSQTKIIVQPLSAKLVPVWKSAVVKHRGVMLSTETATPNHLIDKCSQKYFLSPLEAKEHLRNLWNNDAHLFCSLFSCLGSGRGNSEDLSVPVDMFFVDVVAVPPTRFRPVSY